MIVLYRDIKIYNVIQYQSQDDQSRGITMPFNTALTRKLGIKIPIVQGGMM